MALPTQRFATFQEWTDYVRDCPPARTDDAPVIVGQSEWPRRRATRDELLALVRRCEAEDAAEASGE